MENTVKNLTANVPEHVYRRVEHIAEDEMCSLSDVLRTALKFYLTYRNEHDVKRLSKYYEDFIAGKGGTA